VKGIRRGTRLGKYRLERRLGEGGFAEVWLGMDTVQRRRVAIKVIGPQAVESFGREAIEQEVRVAARLDHPNIVSVRNADWHGPYFVIVTDPALRSLEGYGSARRSPELALSIVRGVASGLAYAHQKKILHRDVKPANILLYPGHVAKLADFGTARFAPISTRVQTEVGTLGYMAPEQAYGHARYASDVFSLGLTAYELFTGTLPTWPFEWPFVGHRRFESRVPEPVQRVVRRAIQVDLQARWRDGVAFHQALERAIPSEPRERGRPRPTRRKSHRRPSKTPFELETRWFTRQYRDALQLEYQCHACDGPIAEAMRACPWCGTDRNSFVEITRYPLVCPECERGVRPEWDACPWCYAGRFESNGRPPPPDPRAVRRCRRTGCDGQIRPFMRYCPRCKTKVTRAWRVEGLRPCSRCRWPTSEHWRFCPWCARRQRDSLRIQVPADRARPARKRGPR
jgi:serine/threonine-protein kinase